MISFYNRYTELELPVTNPSGTVEESVRYIVLSLEECLGEGRKLDCNISHRNRWHCLGTGCRVQWESCLRLSAEELEQSYVGRRRKR